MSANQWVGLLICLAFVGIGCYFFIYKRRQRFKKPMDQVKSKVNEIKDEISKKT